MNLIYQFFNYVGYFLILIIFSIIAIIFAKKLHAWIWYIIGAAITLISLIGNQKSYSYFGLGEYMTSYWLIYIVLLVSVAIVIIARYSKANNTTENPKTNGNDVLENADGSSEKKQYLHKCELCDCGCDKITYAKITDELGIRYRNLCDACMEKYHAVPTAKK